MEIDKKGLPIHKDATVKIRPRIFLEGNFFVDMQPGTPGAPTLGDGDTLPITQTSTPVQLDQVLTALQQRHAQRSCRRCWTNYGKALTAKPTPAQDAEQDPSVRGLTGGARRSTELQVRRPGASRASRSSTRRSWGPSRTTCRSSIAGPAQDHRGPRAATRASSRT